MTDSAGLSLDMHPKKGSRGCWHQGCGGAQRVKKTHSKESIQRRR
uniref:Uncharacterized protein n=1 Tax=Lepeophtheirus salmonis TaxID=72036 RepID=A0A0K2TJ13_LEPSM